MNREIIEGFEAPDAIYRSAPFWSWNDNLEVEELCFQLDQMKEGGFGGGFMHSRIGLITPYLSEKWLNCIEQTTKYARKIGLRVYLYDEDRWPSGFAGGMVTKKGSNRIKFLKVFKRGRKWADEVCKGRNHEWFNGSTYADLMNEKAVEDFLYSTYEIYKKRVETFFGGTIPAIFTDEPNYQSGQPLQEKNAYFFPWTENFEKMFKKRYAYDILKNVKALMKEIPGFETVRYHYYRLITELFVQNFGEKIYEWCEKNGIGLTGHYLAEDTLESQISVIGDAMALYEFMQWPGVDHLGRDIDHPLTLKQCSSVANQLGKERVLSELYGCSGGNFTLAERKWIGDWHVALGVNFFCPHLYLYSLRGCRKRDFPPTISHHQPYWKYNRPLEDYFARLNFIFSKGTFKASILVIHPVESGWCVKGSDKIKELDTALARITQSLLENKFEYDFGNESLMKKYGKVEDGKLKVGKMEYEFVIIPPSITLRESTISLLNEFYAAGGRIFAAEEFPHLVEGRPEEKGLSELKKRCIIYKSIERLIKILGEEVLRKIEIRDTERKNIQEIFIHRRELDSSTSLIFLVNTSLERHFSAELEMKLVGKVWKADPFTGKLEALPVRKEMGEMIINLDFPAVSSRLLVIDEKEEPLIGEKEKLNRISAEKLEDWNLSLEQPNVLALDFCRYKTSKTKNWSRSLPIIEVQDILEKENRRSMVFLLFEFETEKDYIPKELNLVVEQAERYQILLNGEKIPWPSSGWWMDRSFKMVNLPLKAIKKGKNRLALTTLFVPPKKKGTLIFKEDGVELETIYLLGSFSLRIDNRKVKDGGYFQEGFSLTNSGKLTEKDLNLQGYPFYTGSLRAEKKIEIKDLEKRRFIKLGEFKSVVAAVKINEKFAGLVYLPPYEIEITGFLKRGENKISLEIVSSSRNVFGPHHQKDPNPVFVGPGSFLDKKSWVQSYSTLPFGLGRISLLSRGD